MNRSVPARILVCAGLLVGVLWALPGGGSTAPRLLDSARDHYRVGDRTAAWELARRALRNHPGDAETWSFYLWLAPEFQPRSRTFRTLRNLLGRTRDPRPLVEYLRSDAVDTPALRPVVRWSFENGVYDTALVRMHATTLVEEGSHSRAARVLREGLKRYPDSEDLTFLYARALLGTGNCERAGELLRELTRRRPGQTRNYRWFSKVLLAQGRTGPARVLFGRYRALSGVDAPWEGFARDVPSCW